MKKYYLAQIFILFAGIVVAFSAVFQDFARYFDAGGALLSVEGCSVPNPVTTPCFYGAFGFLGAFIVAVLILKTEDVATKLRREKYLSWFLVGGTLFGWFNFVKLYLSYIAGSQIGCSGAPMTNPFLTPCFYGSMLFFLALISSWLILYKEGKQG